jgi:MoaA/NifB/PqqE/SkfB family radical SAM enzyme
MNGFTLKKFFNYIKFKNDLKNKNIITSSFPTFITFQASAYCNTNCQLCPVGVGIKGPEKGFLDFNLFKKIINEAKSYLIQIHFADWGEPFLNPDIFNMILYAEHNKILTSASTNLHRFSNDEDLMKILDCRLSQLSISLHGITQSTYESYQPNKDFNLTLEKIHTLIELKKKRKTLKPMIDLTFAITKKNQHEIPDMIQLAQELNVRYTLYTASLNMRFYSGNDVKIMNIIKEWGQDKNLELLNNVKYHKNTINKLYQTILKEGKVDYNKIDELKFTTRHFCVDPWQSMIVNWDGTISLCCVDYYKYLLGDTKKESIIDIWNNSRYQNAREYLKTGRNRMGENIPCSGCISY